MRHSSGCFILGLVVSACGGRHGDANHLEAAGANSTSRSSTHAGGTSSTWSNASSRAPNTNAGSISPSGGKGNGPLPPPSGGVTASSSSIGPSAGLGDAGAGGNGSAHGGPASSGSPGTGTAGSAGNADCACLPLEQCHEGKLCVAKLVPLPPGFSIDATEVTQGQYRAWLLTHPSTENQAGTCASNHEFVPDGTCLGVSRECSDSKCANYPQVCIDWCDATAYCRAVGKHLCGSIAGAGGHVDVKQLGDAQASQWYAACSSGGKYAYVYGNTALNDGTCQKYVDPNDTPTEVGRLEACQSPDAAYAGVFDLIGNVGEWENNCQVRAGGTSDRCYVRGSSFEVGTTEPTCDGEQKLFPVGGKGPEIGFRCCKD